MKLLAEIGGERILLDVRREGERVFAEVDGRRYELEARGLGGGEYLLLHDGHVYECRVEETPQPGAVAVSVRGRFFQFALADPKRLRGARAATDADAGRAQIVAPMPGKVVRVLIEQGEAVEAGAGVVVVEAMKMQNELKSPKAGTVVEVHAKAGATVNAGEVLIVVE